MIIDHLLRSPVYQGLSPDFARGFEFLRGFDARLPDGRYEIDLGRTYATVVSHETKIPADAKLEAHRLHADIHFLLRGEEAVWFAPFEQLGAGSGYVPDKDYEHFPAPSSPQRLALSEGQFIVLFPGEGHRANCALHSPAKARKIVVKVRVP